MEQYVLYLIPQIVNCYIAHKWFCLYGWVWGHRMAWDGSLNSHKVVRGRLWLSVVGYETEGWYGVEGKGYKVQENGREGEETGGRNWGGGGGRELGV